MEATVRSTVRCDDGTELAVDWVYPDAPQYEWMFEREHWPRPLTPMELWLWQAGVGGSDRAWHEIGMIPPPMFYRFQMAGPFLYARVSMPSPERIAEMTPRVMEVATEFGDAHSFWKKYCEPRIVRSCDELGSMSDGDPGAAAELYQYGLHQTFTCLALMFLPAMRLEAMLGEFLSRDEAELTASEVTQGGENATQAIDFEIWELAELARGMPAVARILESDRSDHLDALRREASAAAFTKAFDGLIARHGRRSQGWTLMDPTWRERPDLALALVRAQMGAERVSPDEQRERSARARQLATERVLAALSPERHEEFRGIVRDLDGYVAVREGRAYWQLVICGELRGVVLRLGSELARIGRIASADDVFFVTPDDVQGDSGAARGADLRDRVSAGRAEWERWRGVEPPAVIGTPGEVAAATEEMRAPPGAASQGRPASRGRVTGAARILHSPEEGWRLQRGDILVCVMTTPAWTPLFAIAGGIVTETGGALSHPAITAREYGIPAVVALENATTRFKDGQLITVDGGAGTVSPTDEPHDG